MRRVVLAGFAAALFSVGGGVGGAVWASHQFSDVGTGTFFHDSIGNIASAGCASGFSNGTFQPNSNPTRGQFAYWTANCGTRVAFDRVDTTAPTTRTEVATVTVEAGALDNPPLSTGGFVWVMADYAAGQEIPAATHEVQMRLRDGDTSLAFTYLDLTNNQSFNNRNGADSEVVAIAGGESRTFSVDSWESEECGAEQPFVTVTLTTLYVPFDGTGAGGGAAPLGERAPAAERP